MPCPCFASLRVSPPVFRRKELVSTAAGADSPPVGPQKQRRQPKGKAGSPRTVAGGWVSRRHPRPSPPVPLAWGGGNERPCLPVSTVAGAAVPSVLPALRCTLRHLWLWQSGMRCCPFPLPKQSQV